jgi:hypothetical protein
MHIVRHSLPTDMATVESSWCAPSRSILGKAGSRLGLKWFWWGGTWFHTWARWVETCCTLASLSNIVLSLLIATCQQLMRQIFTYLNFHKLLAVASNCWMLMLYFFQNFWSLTFLEVNPFRFSTVNFHKSKALAMLIDDCCFSANVPINGNMYLNITSHLKPMITEVLRHRLEVRKFHYDGRNSPWHSTYSKAVWYNYI